MAKRARDDWWPVALVDLPVFPLGDLRMRVLLAFTVLLVLAAVWLATGLGFRSGLGPDGPGRPGSASDFVPLLDRLETAPELRTPWPGLQRQVAEIGEPLAPTWAAAVRDEVAGFACTVTGSTLRLDPPADRSGALRIRWRPGLAPGRPHLFRIRIGLPVTSPKWIECVRQGAFRAAARPCVRFVTPVAGAPAVGLLEPAAEPPGPAHGRIEGSDLLASPRNLFRHVRDSRGLSVLLDDTLTGLAASGSDQVVRGETSIRFASAPAGTVAELGLDLEEVAGPLEIELGCVPYVPGSERLHGGLYRYARANAASALVKRMVRGSRADRLALLLPPPSVVAFDVAFPAEAMLTFAVKAEPPLDPGAPSLPARLVVEAEGKGPGSRPTVLHEERIEFDAGRAPGEWQERTVACGMPPGTRGRLRIRVEAASDPGGAVVAVADPILFRPGRGREIPSLLVITVDSLRRDYLGLLEEGRSLTPDLDAFAAEGVTVSHAVTTGLNTYTALPSFVTSSAAMSLGTEGFTARPDPDLPTLAEVLRSHGRFVRAFLPDIYMNSFLKGFTARDRIGPRSAPGVDDAERVERALAFLDRHREDPFHLWVHLDDPHVPWLPEKEAAPPWELEGAPDPGADRPFERLRVAVECVRSPTATPAGQAAAARFLNRCYRAEVRRADRLVGRLLAGLGRSGRAGNTLVMIHADHGIEVDGERVTERSFGDGTIRVPLVFRHPGVLPAGKTRRGVMSLLDAAPTLLGLLGLEAPAAWQGVDRSSWLRGEVDCVDPAAPEGEGLDLRHGRAVVRHRDRAAIRTLGWRWEREVGGDIATGRLERDGEGGGSGPNLAGRRPKVAAALDRLLEAALESRASGFTAGALTTPMRDFLRRAGYVPEPQSAAGNRATWSPILLAHRGDALFAPENSLLAIERAIAAGADGVELDVRLCGTGEAVVFHDEALERMTGRGGRVEATSLAALRELALRYPPGAEGPVQRVPAVEEVLERFGGRTILFLEMKLPEDRERARDLAQAVAEALQRRRLEGRTFVSSLCRPLIAWTAARYPSVRTVYEFGEDREIESRPAERPGDLAAVDWVGPALGRLDRPFAAWARERARFQGISTYTAVTVADLERARDLGADLIQTDVPRLAALWRDGRLAGKALASARELPLDVELPAELPGGSDRLPWVAAAVKPGGVYAVVLEAEAGGRRPETHGLLAAVEEAEMPADRRGEVTASELPKWLAGKRHTVVQQYRGDRGRFRTILFHRAGPSARALRIVHGIPGADRGFTVERLTLRAVEE